MRRRTLITGTVIGTVAALGLAAPAQAQPLRHHPAQAAVSILHEVPNVPVDVYLNHHRVLNDFQPGSYAGPLKVDAGRYTVTITAASAKNDRKPVIGPLKVSFGAHRNYTVVAHLTASGTPTATSYFNTLRHVAVGNGRLIVRHDAAAPAVDILVNGSAAMTGLHNPHQSKAQVPAGTYQVAVALAGTTAPVIGPATLPVAKNADTIAYAWGSAADANLALAVQVIALHHGWYAPTSFIGLKPYQG